VYDSKRQAALFITYVRTRARRRASRSRLLLAIRSPTSPSIYRARVYIFRRPVHDLLSANAQSLLRLESGGGLERGGARGL